MHICCGAAFRTFKIGFFVVCFAAGAQGGGRGDSGHGDGLAHDLAKIRADCGSAWQLQCPADHPRGLLEDASIFPAAGAEGAPTRDHRSVADGQQSKPAPSSHSRDKSRRPPVIGGLDGQNSVSSGARNALLRPKADAVAGPLPVRRVGSSVGSAPTRPGSISPTVVVAPAPRAMALQQTAALAKRLAARPTTNSLILADNNGTFIGDCADKDVTIVANNGRFVLSGGCRSLTVSGYNNKVLVELVGGSELDVLRQSNLVAWAKPESGADPLVLSAGKANATASLSVAPPLSEPIERVPTGADLASSEASSDVGQSSNTSSFIELSKKIPALDDLIIVSTNGGKTVHDCTDKDVAISASGASTLLTGGCRSVTVSGSANKVLAEMAGGGELSVLRSHNAVAWMKVGTGAEQILVHADNSNRTVEMIPTEGRADLQRGQAP
jgi:Protein of unknown function (DUF3060)